jgi:aspartate 1-decarboxylase
VKGEPASDAPLAQRIRFAISKQAQVTAGRAATTTVNCPGIDKVEKAGKHTLKCTVKYAGKPYEGTLTVDAKQYSASYKFTSEKVAIVRPKVVDAVLRTVPGAAKVTCTMEDVVVVATAGQPIACDVTTTANAVEPYRAQVSGNGQILVSKA